MVLYLSVYLIVFGISIFMIYLFQRTQECVTIQRTYKRTEFSRALLYCVLGCVFLLPIIVMFSLRKGIGTDYYSYQAIYNAVHNKTFSEYWINHNKGVTYFYIEPGYYFLNRIFPSYRSLLWGIGILFFSLFLLGIKDYFSRINVPFAFFIFLSTLFIYSLNAMRFAVGLCFVLIAYQALAQNKTLRFVIIVLLAALFHKTSLFCLAMVLLKPIKNWKIDTLRNLALFVFILSFPVISKYLFRMFEYIPVFARYFSTSMYSASNTMSRSWIWMLHVVPVYLPLLVLCGNEIINANDTETLFRICIMEIPFRMLGLYNTWYTRFARYSQIAQVLFIPLVLSKLKSRKKKIILYTYYIVWFVFYFAYYAVVNDQGDSLPYVWIFSK